MAVFNVRDFGATGSGTTDDTAAIVAAILSTVAANKYGGAVYFPAGKYLVTDGTAGPQQYIRISGATTGNFTLSVVPQTGMAAQVTQSIPYNQGAPSTNATNMQNALAALPSIGAGNVTIGDHTTRIAGRGTQVLRRVGDFFSRINCQKLTPRMPQYEDSRRCLNIPRTCGRGRG